MLILVMLFGILVPVLSYSVAERSRRVERGELSTYIVFIAWGSLILGLSLARLAG